MSVEPLRAMFRPPAVRGQRGFTLIELMVTVALIALLAAIVYPSYRQSVQKARRVEAKSALTDAAQRLERHYTENNSYLNAAFCSVGSGRCTEAIQVGPPASENGYYLLSFDATAPPTATTFTIVAVPQGGQVDDACGSFRLNQAGVRQVVDGRGTVSDGRACW